MNELWKTRAVQAWPVLVLALLAVLFVFMLLFSRKAPIISSLEPSMAAPGQQVVVTGDYFGRTEREGSLSLAGEIPPPSLIQSWSDQKIVLVIPEDASSGLVTVSNSQGTSTGVLFTNTSSIPTVLQAAAEPSQPLVWAVLPSQPLPGQVVTLTGRGFGDGDEAVEVEVTTPNQGPVLEVGPAESLLWSGRSVRFRWPGGATGSSVSVITPRGRSPSLVMGGPGPMGFETPRKITVEFRARVAQPASTALTLWGPVPQRDTGVVWSLVSADPAPLPGRGPAFSWAAGSAADREAVYRLTLTTWSRRWDGLVSGQAPTNQDLPAGDDTPRLLWKPATAALKNLVARWGLETPDPWLKIQRLQTGLAASFPAAVGPREKIALTRTPAELLTPGTLTSYEISTLAAFLASQAGLPSRLVEGLWLRGDGTLVGRTWTEVWLAGAGWISWDVIDGNPGALDNKHFGFEVGIPAPIRRLPRSKTFGPAAPGSLVNASGEASGPGAEPVVQWQITRWEK